MDKVKKLSIFVKGIFLLITLFFLFGIYLSIPVLFNYKSIENIIENKFYSNFDIRLNINGDIRYQLLPKPHLLIHDSLISLDDNNYGSISFNTKDLKIFLNSNSLYPKSKIKFQTFEIKNTNFLFKIKEYGILRKYFHNSDSKPFQIKKSKVFILDDKNETLIISPLEKIIFTTSKKDNLKKLNIVGNIFDIDFKSLWKKKINSQMSSQIEIDFKRPNILIKNLLDYESNSNLKGSVSLNYLNQIIEIDYKLKNKLITLKSPDNANDIKLDAVMELKPFNLNSNITLNRQNLNFLIDELIFSTLNLKSDLLGNLNGDINLTLTNIEHELIRSGNINFQISEKTIKLTDLSFNLSEIGIVKSQINYSDENGEINFNSSNTLTIKNNKNFAKKFQLNLNKVKDLNTIYFKIKKNINSGLISIYDIKIDRINKIDIDTEELRYNIKNSQELKSLVKKLLNN